MIGLLVGVITSPHFFQVMLKTLCVLHKLMRDGDTRFKDVLTQHTYVFNVAHFQPGDTPEAWEFADLIRQYAEYLEERVCQYREQRSRREDKAFKDMSVNEIVGIITGYVRCLEMMGRVDMKRHHLSNPAAVTSLSYILKDAFSVYRTCVEGITAMLGMYCGYCLPCIY